MKLFLSTFIVVLLVSLSCASLMEDKATEVSTQTQLEYEKVVKVKEIKATAPTKTPIKKKKSKQKKVTKTKVKAKKVKRKKALKGAVLVKKPSIEDKEGFVGRRPVVDPFKVGEKIIWDVSYMGMSAGEISLETRPFVEVNKKKSYHFLVKVKSSSIFAMFYKVKDYAEAYVDYAEMKPHSLEVHVKESKQIKEGRTYFDWDKLEGHYWMKRKKKGRKEEEKKKLWAIKNYSQNFISAMFYLRVFTWKPGKTIKFYMADEGKNFLFKAKVLRKETISTDAGKFKTIVIKPEVEVNGSLKPVGDIELWLTDDDRKFLVKIKTAIKIGSIVAEAKLVKP